MQKFSHLAARAAAIVAGALLSSASLAADYTWSNLAGGTAAWNNAANWGGAGFPNLSGDKGDLNVGITANLGVNLASNFTLSTLVLGSSTNAITTDIGNANSTGNGLIFDNGGTIFSRGVAGVNNVISAPLYIGNANTAFSTLTVGSTDNTADPLLGQRSLVINGIIQPLGADRGFTNNLRNGATITINGDIVLSGVNDTANPTTNGSGRRLLISGAATGRTIINGKFLAGTLPLAGITGASGPISMGNSSNAATNVPIADAQPHNFVLNAVNTAFTGNVVLNRGTYILGAADALGTGEVRGGNPSNQYGFNLEATTDNYQVNFQLRTVQNITVRGTNQIIFNKEVFGTQNRAFMNMLPEGKTVTMTKLFATAANTGDSRNPIFDGTGTTILQVGIKNYYNGSTAIDDNAGNGGSVVQRGTGKLIVDGTSSTMRGYAMASGGLFEFASSGSYGVQADNGTGVPNVGASAMFTNPGGAIGVRTGSLDPAFLNLFTRDYPSAFGTFNDSAGNQVLSRGSIALSTADAATNIDFNSGDLTNDRLKNVSIGALNSGVTYTGTITPGADNTYRLGGGTTLTMANANAITGARNLEVVNGGTVVLAQANNYTGTTSVQGVWVATGIENANASSSSTLQSYTDAGGTAVTDRLTKGVRIAPTLEIKSAAALGNTSAINVRGATLKYTGSANDSTSKAITIGSAGATLDSSGTGTISFNAAAAIQEDQADITSQISNLVNAVTTANGGSINFGNNDPLLTANLGVGWTVAGPGIPTTATITGLATNSNGNPSISTHIVAWLKSDSGSIANNVGGGTYTFTNQARTLTLTGSNTGNNALNSALADSAKGKLSLAKSGSGTWVVGGSNSYTGATTVNAGTLALGHVNALGNTSGTTVKSGATLAIGTAASTAVKIDSAKLVREAGSKLDLMKGKLVLDYTGSSPLAAVQADILSGYAGGAFGGNGITTSSSISGTHLRVGYAEASQLNLSGTYFGQSVDADAIILAGTYAGDTNLDGTVNFDDLLKLAQNYNNTGKVWSDGDFDYNGSVVFDDLLALAQSYNSTVSLVDVSEFGSAFASDWAMALSLAPEPMSLSALAALGMIAGRRRRD